MRHLNDRYTRAVNVWTKAEQGARRPEYPGSIFGTRELHRLQRARFVVEQLLKRF